MPTDRYLCRLALLLISFVADSTCKTRRKWAMPISNELRIQLKFGPKTEINRPDAIRHPGIGLVYADFSSRRKLNSCCVFPLFTTLLLYPANRVWYRTHLKFRLLRNSWALLHSVYSVGAILHVRYPVVLSTSAMHHNINKDMLWDRTKAFDSIFEFHPELLFVCVELNPRRISLAALQKNPFIFLLLLLQFIIYFYCLAVSE